MTLSTWLDEVEGRRRLAADTPLRANVSRPVADAVVSVDVPMELYEVLRTDLPRLLRLLRAAVEVVESTRWLMRYPGLQKHVGTQTYAPVVNTLENLDAALRDEGLEP